MSAQHGQEYVEFDVHLPLITDFPQLETCYPVLYILSLSVSQSLIASEVYNGHWNAQAKSVIDSRWSLPISLVTNRGVLYVVIIRQVLRLRVLWKMALVPYPSGICPLENSQSCQNPVILVLRRWYSSGRKTASKIRIGVRAIHAIATRLSFSFGVDHPPADRGCNNLPNLI